MNGPRHNAGATDLAELESEISEPEPEAEVAPKRNYQQEVRESPRIREEFRRQEQICEAAALATYLEGITTALSEDEAIGQLTDYFEQKQKFPDLYNFAEAGTLAREIWSIEEKVRAISAEGIKPEVRQSIRESLLAVVLSGKLSAEAVLERLNGRLAIAESPGDEIGDYQNPENLAAFFTVENDRSNVYLYGNFISEDSAKQRHHLQHELGHLFAETGAIWDQRVFLAFLNAVSTMDDAKIAEIAEQAPELANIYHLIKSPQEAIFFRPYIRDKLNALPELPDAQKSQARVTAAKEIIAEMTAFYLGSANSELSYLNARLAMVGDDTMELLRQILSPERFDTFKERYDLEGKSLGTEDVLDFIKSAPEFQAEFQAQETFLKKTEQAFAQRGNNIRPMGETMKIEESTAYADEYFDDWDELYFPPISGGISGGDRKFSYSGGQTSPTKDPITAIWDFITGNKEPSPTLK